jgi:hypothetical protein
LNGSFILLLLSEYDGCVATGASPKSAYKEQPVQVTQGIYRDSRHAERHPGTDAGIQHPGWQRGYDARLDLNMNDAAGSALFAVMGICTSTVERMPAIVNFNFLPDMGRMAA